MKIRAVLLILMLSISLFPIAGIGQNCDFTTKTSIIHWDQVCSPVEVVSWELSYSGVNDNGSTVTVYIDWDDGFTETLTTTESPDSTFTAIGAHTYVSMNEECFFRPAASLIVNGSICPLSSQDETVYIWDVDNANGAAVIADPDVYPICIGNSATMRFSDNTKYNCVPPQEEINRNESTRWIQWVYGTNAGSPEDMTVSGTGVDVDGHTAGWPYETEVITLTGPSWGSTAKSLPIFVSDDKLIGQEFEVVLRYWNYCNKQTDGADPVTDTSVIRIVPFPDATIDQIGPVCEFSSNIILTAATVGGIWSGPGIIDGTAGIFSPSTAGDGSHEIKYEVSEGLSCMAEDTVIITVLDAPDGSITPVDPVCFGDAIFNMTAASTPGTWSGKGITNTQSGSFSPSIAGIGSHEITYKTSTGPSGCFGTDTSIVHVAAPPYAAFLTPDSSWCEQTTNSSIGTLIFTGSDTTIFDLVYEANGTIDTLFNISSDTFDLDLNNTIGENLYVLKKVIEHHGNNTCETSLSDTLSMTVRSAPYTTFSFSDEYLCSPAEVEFTATEGYDKYSWVFGDGEMEETDSNQISHTYTYAYSDNKIIVDGETVSDLTRHDTVYAVSLHVESLNGCEGDFEDSIKILPTPEANLFVTPVIQHYPDSLVYLINLTSDGVWEYEWNFGDSKTSQLKEPDQHIYNIWGIYDISLRAFSPFCSDTMTKRVQIMPPPPLADFISDTTGCPPFNITIRNTSEYADNFFWDFGDGDLSSEAHPTHTYMDPGRYTITLTASGLSGIDTTEQSLVVYEPPQAMFDYSPRVSSNLKEVYRFSNTSLKASYYQWDFGDGTTSVEKEPYHIYEDPGTYQVTLYVWSDKDCVDTMVHASPINAKAGEGSIEFPTVFFWNGTGPTGGGWHEGSTTRNIFHPNPENVLTYKMVIYTRWGQQIFETNDLYIGWDGYMDEGNLAAQGVYIYKVWVKYMDGLEEILAGDITFLH